MIKVCFVTTNRGTQTRGGGTGRQPSGARPVAGMPLEGTCEGQMACSTCHVVIAKKWFARLKPASEDEEDMSTWLPGYRR